jgi:hypothetical protein
MPPQRTSSQAKAPDACAHTLAPAGALACVTAPSGAAAPPAPSHACAARQPACPCAPQLSHTRGGATGSISPERRVPPSWGAMGPLPHTLSVDTLSGATHGRSVVSHTNRRPSRRGHVPGKRGAPAPRGGVPRPQHRSARLCRTQRRLPAAVPPHPSSPRHVPCRLYAESGARRPHRCCPAARAAAHVSRSSRRASPRPPHQAAQKRLPTRPVMGRGIPPAGLLGPGPPLSRRVRRAPHLRPLAAPARAHGSGCPCGGGRRARPPRHRSLSMPGNIGEHRAFATWHSAREEIV